MTTIDNVRPYTGLLNDVRIYDRVLNPCEIHALSNDSTTSPNLRKIAEKGIEKEGRNSLNIYPNPTSESLNIYSSDTKLSSIVVLNSIGKTVMINENIAGNSYQINLGKQPKGIYYINVVDEKGTLQSKKVIKL